MHISFSLETLATYLRTAVDIIVVWILVYYLLKIVKNNQRTIQIFKGILMVVIIQAVAKLCGLATLEWLTDNVMSWGFLALIVLFQPEIRSVLERLGKTNALSRITVLTGTEKANLIDEVMAAVVHLAESKTGALITIEQSHSLTDFVKTGIQINSLISAELLCSIFDTSTPMHDGAVIIQGDRLACASAYFPPTNMDLPSRYGARHRAAIGISEISDAVTIVVSEETGRVSVTTQGKILQMNEKKLREYLNRVILNNEHVASNTSGNIGSESISVKDIIDSSDLNAEEQDFVSPDDEQDNAQNHVKNMKSFGTAEFKQVSDTKGNPKVKTETTLNRVVKETIDSVKTPQPENSRIVRQIDDTGVVKEVRIKTVSLPKADDRPIIKTQSVSQGKPQTKNEAGGDK